MPITPEESALYRETHRRRRRERDAANEARRRRALTFAHAAAELLRRDWGITRVVLFGSALRPGAFHERSDLDLAVWGLTTETWLTAWNAADALEPEIALDLVDQALAKPHIMAAILRDGVEI